MKPFAELTPEQREIIGRCVSGPGLLRMIDNNRVPYEYWLKIQGKLAADNHPLNILVIRNIGDNDMALSMNSANNLDELKESFELLLNNLTSLRMAGIGKSEIPSFGGESPSAETYFKQTRSVLSWDESRLLIYVGAYHIGPHPKGFSIINREND